MTPQAPWRGYVNMITYGVDLTNPVSAASVAAVAENLVQERSYAKPLSVYYTAATEALASDEQLESNARAFLRRLTEELDRRRPWPEPLFSFRDTRDWASLRNAPEIGRIHLAEDEIHRRLGRGLLPIAIDDHADFVLILHLRTGQSVGIHSPTGRTADSLRLVTTAEPGQAISDFRELTGLPVEPSTAIGR